MKKKRDESAIGSNTRGRKRSTLIGTVALLAAATFLLAACGSSASHGGQQPRGRGFAGGRSGGVPVQAVKVTYGPLNAVHNVAGSVVPVTQSNVAAQVSGVVETVEHDAGNWVTAGETVVQLDSTQLQLAVKNAAVALQNAQINLTVGQQNIGFDTKKLQLQLQSAQSALAAAQKNYDALESGYKQGNVAASDVDTAQSQLQQAEANYQSAKTALEQNKNAESQSIAQLKLAVQTADNQLAQAKLNLGYASITAPFAGQISVVNVTPGEFVGQNAAAFVLVSSARQISFNVPPSDAPILTVGTKVTFVVGGDTYTAQVSQTPSAPVSGVVPLTAKLVGTTSLPFGTVGTVSYPVTVSKGTLVPLAALQNDGSQNYVFTILQGKAHVQPITILGETGSTAAVSQLDGGAQVVLNPPPGLLEGAAVVPAGSGQGQANQSPNGQRGASPGGGGQKQQSGPGGAQSAPNHPAGSQGGSQSSGGRAQASGSASSGSVAHGSKASDYHSASGAGA